jgi:UDPglucose--hexose-1-phosphate uridylyltransferase
MPEMRQDPATKEWVIIATERRKRPTDFVYKEPRKENPSAFNSCPFCPGHESMALPEVLAYKKSGTDSWQVRAFANMYPAVVPEGSTSRRIDQGIFLSVDGIGRHEVIVETPEHHTTLALMDDAGVAAVLRAYRARYEAMTKFPSIKSVIIFKNHGLGAGTSLEHPHSQLVATTIVPRHIRMQYEVAISYYDDTGRCLYNDLAAREQDAGTRIVLDTERYLVFHPFASHRPFETWVMPREHQSSFVQASPEDLQSLASVLRLTLLKLYQGLNNPDYNLVIDSAPLGEEHTDFYQWHIRIIPRITEAAGFEIGSGIFINTSLPEETAQYMRGLVV